MPENFSLWRSNNFDFFGGKSQRREFVRRALADTLEHGGAAREYENGKEVSVCVIL